MPSNTWNTAATTGSGIASGERAPSRHFEPETVDALENSLQVALQCDDVDRQRFLVAVELHDTHRMSPSCALRPARFAR